MKPSIWTRLIVTALAVCTAAALAAPAWGKGGGGALTLHRDGSQAEPFVAQVGPQTGAASGDGFDWGDAGIGAAGTLALAAIAGGAAVVARNRNRRGTVAPRTQ